MAMTHKDIISMMAIARPIVNDEFALRTIDMFPSWESVIGKAITQDMIDKGLDRFQDEGELYSVIQPHTPQADWKPKSTPALYKKVSLEEWPEWRQPTGAHDAYNIGDKVTYNGQKYKSKIDGNTTVPGSDERFWEKVL